ARPGAGTAAGRALGVPLEPGGVRRGGRRVGGDGRSRQAASAGQGRCSSHAARAIFTDVRTTPPCPGLRLRSTRGSIPGKKRIKPRVESSEPGALASVVPMCFFRSKESPPMKRIFAMALVPLLTVAVWSADDADKPNTLTPKEIADGWILPWDGETTFG